MTLSLKLLDATTQKVLREKELDASALELGLPGRSKSGGAGLEGGWFQHRDLLGRTVRSEQQHLLSHSEFLAWIYHLHRVRDLVQ